MKASTKIARKNIEDIIALTSMQEGMLFHYLEDPQRDYYFEQLDLVVSGEIEIQTFEKAWNFVIETNEMLRTFYRWEDVEQPVQIVLKKHRIRPVYFDFSGKDPNEKKKRLEEVIINDRGKKFDLQDVPFRITLCKLETDKYRVIVSNHHILYDGWSNGIILKEFFKAYDDLSKGRDPAKFFKTRFKEFIYRMQNQDIEKQEKYWRSYLEGFETCTALPVKRKKTAQINHNKTYSWKWGREKTNELTDFLKKHQLTFASLLYSAWGILLQKYNNSDDVVFGTTVSGRSVKLAGIEDMVGLFINTLPLRTRSRPREKAGDLLKWMETELHLRQHVEHSSLVNIRKWSEISKGEELFDSIVILENYPLEKRLITGNKGLSIDRFSIFEMTHYDLTVIVSIFAEIEVKMIYPGDLFDDESIERLMVHFTGIVEMLMENSGQLTAKIEIISKEEKNKILYDFNDTQAEYPADKTIHQLFAEQAARTPGHTALVGKEEGEKGRRVEGKKGIISISYRELNNQSNRLAHWLSEEGVEPDTIVGIEVERSPEMVIGILGILKAGGAYLPINPDYLEERKKYMLKDSNADVLLTRKDITSFPSTLTSTSTCRVSSANLAYVIYTSGSTGKPKGVMVNQRPVVNLLVNLQRKYPLEEIDGYLLKTPFIFDVSVTELFGWFPGGGRLVILSPGEEKNPGTILDTIERCRVTHINFVPSMFRVFLEMLNPENVKKLSYLRYIFLAGEALLPGLIETSRALNIKSALENLYGPTEAAVYAAGFSLSRWNNPDPVPIGRPLANSCIYILDRNFQVLSIGIPGQLYIGGEGLARGYLNGPELTAERFVKDVIRHSSLVIGEPERPLTPLIPNDQCPMTNDGSSRLYRTGDLARWLPDGNIEFLGRMDHQVKIRGYRIELGEIENRLLTHRQIKEAIVIAREDKDEKHLCAYIVAERTAHGTEREEINKLREYLSQLLPDYMVPSYFVQLDRIPLTPSGKIDRKSLPLPKASVDETFAPPEDEVQRQLVEIWSDLTGIEKEKISIDANFFQLGGHSLKAVLMTARIHKEFNINIPVSKMFKTPTVRGIAELIAAFDWVYDDNADRRQKREEILL